MSGIEGQSGTRCMCQGERYKPDTGELHSSYIGVRNK